MNHFVKTLLVGLALAVALAALPAFAQKERVVGVTKEEAATLTKGWSIKKDIMGQDVYNESNEKVGTVEDIIVTSDKGLSYAIIGAGGFLGMGKHDVAIPVTHFKIENKKIMLPGATKEAIKAAPEFKYKD